MIAFGPFRFLPAQQLLLAGETPVHLGSRARGILAALLERPGEVVGKQELMSRVWPNTFVEEANLRVHVTALRKALAEADSAAGRYITNVSGRGYCFVAPVVQAEDPPPRAGALPPAAPRPDPPAAAERIVGRADIVSTLAAHVLQHRCVTITGPGGIGKTTVARSVVNAVLGGFRDGVRFVDLAPLSDPQLVPTALAAVLGVAVVSEQPGRNIVLSLRDKHLLIVLDNCEHVIDAAAALVAEILAAAPGAHLLATSREALDVAGEWVQRLAPLACPPAAARPTAAEALAYPAVQLFVERAAARIGAFALGDADALRVCDICRRLDGIALAIEIAAGRVDAFGIAGLAGMLDDRFRLQMRGRRTAMPRHQTMSTALDWSHALLPATERAVLRRLAIFVGVFTMDAACAVLADAAMPAGKIVECVANLIGKSLISANIDGPVAEYRLLDTTRAYAALKLQEQGERDAYARRHAAYCRDLLEGARPAWETSPAAEWLEGHRHLIDNVRAALDWSFSPTGDTAIGIPLTVAAVPLWFQMSLISECQQRVQGALSALLPPARDGADALRLNATLAWSLMQTKGLGAATLTAWTRVLELAEAQGDVDHQLRAIWGLWAGGLNHGDLRGALALAQRFHQIAEHAPDRSDLFVGDRMVGHTYHLLGDQATARRYLERMLEGYVVPVIGAQFIRYVFDQRVTARCFLARIQWLQGFPDQAMQTVASIVEGAMASRDPLSLCQALVQAACPVALLVGNLAEAERFVTMLSDHAARHGFEFWQKWGRSFEGLLLVQRREVAVGLRLLDAAIGDLRGIEFGVYYTWFLAGFAEGLGRAGQAAEGLQVIDQALARSDANDERWCVADLLRIKGDLVRQSGSAAAADRAEEHYRNGLDWARRQGARSWELRLATSLARAWHARGRNAEARSLLAAVRGRFEEGFGTADMIAATALLGDLGPHGQSAAGFGPMQALKGEGFYLGASEASWVGPAASCAGGEDV